MKIKLICLCGEEWEEDLDKFIEKITAQWSWWITLGQVSTKTQEMIKKQHCREKLIDAFKEKGFLQCMCEKCQKRTTQLAVSGEDFTKDIAFTGRIK